MTRPSTEQGVKIALAALAKKSVRKACKEGGISVTTLYNKTTPKEREEAAQGKIEAAVPKKRGRPARVQSNESLPRNNSSYVAKLERALLKRLLEE